MSINLLYFASLREQLNLEQENLNLNDSLHTVADLKAHLQQRGEPWLSQFADSTRLMVAVNQQIANNETQIKTGDEVAFFPPVTGG
jgi:molybdopterin synthase sulfur carrier subunit